LFGPKFQDPLYSLLLYIFLLKTKYPFNKSKICCQGRVAFGLLNINFLFKITDLIKSGIILSFDQSPPPITFPALAETTPVLILFS
jgi:hypothetical protein